MQRKDYAGAIQYFRRAVRLSPRNSAALRSLHLAEFELQYQAGLRSSEQEKFGYAKVRLRRALQIAIEHRMREQTSQANLQLALVDGSRLMRRQSYESAAKSYEKALAFSPNNRAALAGLTEARFRIAYQQGLEALASGDFNRARARFSECLAYKPHSPEALEEVSRVGRIEKDATNFDTTLQAANSAIDRRSWNQAQLEIKNLAAIMQEAGQLGFHSHAIFRYRAMLPAYVSFANGNLKGAYELTQFVQGKADAVRAAKFRRFLQTRSRFDYLYSWGPSLLVGYLAILLGGIFAGLRRIVAGWNPAAG